MAVYYPAEFFLFARTAKKNCCTTQPCRAQLYDRTTQHTGSYSERLSLTVSHQSRLWDIFSPVSFDALPEPQNHWITLSRWTWERHPPTSWTWLRSQNLVKTDWCNSLGESGVRRIHPPSPPMAALFFLRRRREHWNAKTVKNSIPLPAHLWTSLTDSWDCSTTTSPTPCPVGVTTMSASRKGDEWSRRLHQQGLFEPLGHVGRKYWSY